MKYTNILEKLLCLFNIVKTSYIDITFLVIVVVSLILLFRKKISTKMCYIINVISSSILITFVIINNIESLSKTFESVVDYTFTNIYFPSIYVYLVILVVMNLFCILSLFKVRLDGKYKVVNGVSMLVINFVLALILDVIARDNVDLFKKTSLFSNTDLVVMMEFSVTVFLIWCVINLIMYLADNITEKIIIKKNVKELNDNKVDMSALSVTINVDKDEVMDEYVDSTNDALDEDVKGKFIPVELLNNSTDGIQNTKFIPDIDKINNNYIDNSFDLSSLIPQKQGLSVITNNINYVNDSANYYNNSNELLNSILSNDLPFVIKEEKNERDTYTLNDYRIFNKMLKDIKEHNDSNRISIDKNLEYRLITKYSTEAYDMFKKMLKNYSN